MIHTVPDMQVGTATYEGRHRHDDPIRVLNRRPVAEPAADHRPRHAAPEPTADEWPLPAVEIEQAEAAGLVVRPESPAAAVDFRDLPSPLVRADLASTVDSKAAGR